MQRFEHRRRRFVRSFDDLPTPGSMRVGRTGMDILEDAGWYKLSEDLEEGSIRNKREFQRRVDDIASEIAGHPDYDEEGGMGDTVGEEADYFLWVWSEQAMDEM